MNSTAGPLSRYRHVIESGRFAADPAQATAAQALQRVWEGLVAAPKRTWWPFTRRQPATRGLYLWGGVGRGKTWLMDLFFDSLPFDDKRRLHFHRFMASVHEELRAAPEARDPLTDIARRWSGEFRVLCFDEFHVSDIADAMLLGGLLRGLFDGGVTLVATSNVAPDELYRDGLQRARFLPAIETIKSHCHVMHLRGDADYRLRILERAPTYHVPANAAADQRLTESFEAFASDCELPPEFDIGGRRFVARRRGDGVVWFDFTALCREPRSSNDFIELARSYNTVLVSDIPVMGPHDEDAARRFIHLVDELYDRQVKMVVSAETTPDRLYEGRRLNLEFERTASRLTEMQTHEYLSRPHLS